MVAAAPSLTSSPPAGMVACRWPPNVSETGVPVALPPLPCTATVAWPITTGDPANVFARRTRTALPPTLSCTTIRKVCCVHGPTFDTTSGAADQVPVHAPGPGRTPSAKTCRAGTPGATPLLTFGRVTERTFLLALNGTDSG